MDKKKSIVSKLKFENYVVDYVNYKDNKFFTGRSVKINLGADREVVFDESNDKIAFVSLILDVFSNAEENDYPFSISLKITGRFMVDSDINGNVKNHFFEKNAVAILFPYARALVTTFTANSNVPPLILPPININNLID